MADVTQDAFFEIQTEKDGDKYKVKNVTASYATGISTLFYEAIKDNNVYTLDGRLVRTDGDLQQLPKGIYIINKKKVIVK